jgi:hypothetical protein
MFSNFETVKQQIMALDMNVGRSMLVRMTQESRIGCCHKLREKRKETTSVQ